MLGAWYSSTLDQLRAIERGSSDSVHQVDMSGITGIRQRRLNHLFGPTSQLWKVSLSSDRRGIRLAKGAKLKFETSSVTCAFAKPGSRGMYVLVVPGATSIWFEENLRQLGIAVEADSPKLYKRLKRLLCNPARAHTSNFSFTVLPNQPVHVTDGMAMASADFIAGLTGTRPRTGDLFTFSTLTPLGQAKGTLIVLEGLEQDFVVADHNNKPEIKTVDGSRHFWLESKPLEHKMARTDLQSLMNTNNWELFEDSVREQLQELQELAFNPERAAEWFRDEFRDDDWYSTRLERLSSDDRRDLNYEIEAAMPRLTVASRLGIDPRVSPTLRRDIFHYNARRVDIRKFKTPVSRGRSRRAYVIPQLDQFNHRTGEWSPRPETALPAGSIMFPGLPLEQLVVYRQPNAVGEAAVYMNQPARVPSMGVQIGEADARIGALEIHGGMDYDDTLVGVADWWAVGRAKIQMDATRNIPRVDMEKLIDASMALTTRFDFWNQAAAGLRRQDMDLGSAVNFLMNLVLCHKWDWYRDAAACTTDSQLKWLEIQYLQRDATYCDAWVPLNQYKRDRAARVPIKEWDPFSYHEVRAVRLTEAGRLMKTLGLEFDALHQAVRVSLDINNEAWICSPDGMEFLKSLVDPRDGGGAGIDAALALDAVWTRLTGQDPQYAGPWQELVDSITVVLDESTPVMDKIHTWCVACGEVYDSLTDHQGMVATAGLACIWLEWKRRLDPESRQWRWSWGKDSMLWNHSMEWFPASAKFAVRINDDGQVARGPRQYWSAILKRWSDQCLTNK